MKIVIILVSIFVLSSCSSNSIVTEDEKLQAVNLVENICDGKNNLTWSQRNALAAQAAFLDSRWEQLSDATAYQAAGEAIAELIEKKPNLTDYDSQAVDYFYQSQLNYAKFKAQCSILELNEESRK